MEQIGGASTTERLLVEAVDPSQISEIWPRIKPLVEKALRHGEGDSTTADEIKRYLESGYMVLWIVRNTDIVAILILKVVYHPAKKTLYVVLTAGTKFDQWIGQVEQLLKDFADIVGADTIEASARIGLAKKLTGRGWTRKAIIMELPHE